MVEEAATTVAAEKKTVQLSGRQLSAPLSPPPLLVQQMVSPAPPKTAPKPLLSQQNSMILRMMVKLNPKSPNTTKSRSISLHLYNQFLSFCLLPFCFSSIGLLHMLNRNDVVRALFFLFAIGSAF